MRKIWMVIEGIVRRKKKKEKGRRKRNERRKRRKRKNKLHVVLTGGGMHFTCMTIGSMRMEGACTGIFVA